MSLRAKLRGEESVIDQAAGVTGFGWTASLLGYLGSTFGNWVPVAASPQSLLYLGGVCFVTTLGLDRLKRTRSDGGGD